METGERERETLGQTGQIKKTKLRGLQEKPKRCICSQSVVDVVKDLMKQHLDQ